MIRASDLIVMLVLVLGGAHAAVARDTPPLNPAMQARYHSLTAELRCVVCQNRSIAASDAPLAADLRALVERRIRSGQSDARIKRYLVARYGDWILYDPPLQVSTLLLWFGPFILLAIGLVIVVMMRRRSISGEQATSPLDTEAETDKLVRILDEDRACGHEHGR